MAVTVLNTTANLSGKTVAVTENTHSITGAWTFANNLIFTDATYDIGASGATRPRDLFLSRNAIVGGTLSVTGAVVSNLIFTDATYDIGASGATRPRDLFLSRNAVVGGTLAVTGATTLTGTTTNDNAAAGKVGEFISASVAQAGAVALTSGVGADVTSVSLTAGDWDVFANVFFNPNASTPTTNIQAWIHTVSATQPTIPNGGAYLNMPKLPYSNDGNFGFSVGRMRISLAATTTVYLSTIATFTVSTNAAYGFLGARRVR